MNSLKPSSRSIEVSNPNIPDVAISYVIFSHIYRKIEQSEERKFVSTTITPLGHWNEYSRP